MWDISFSIGTLHVLMVIANASQDEIGFLRNQIQQLGQDFAAQKAMNNELRTELYQSRFRRGMILII